jgi:hypothetical protein
MWLSHQLTFSSKSIEIVKGNLWSARTLGSAYMYKGVEMAVEIRVRPPVQVEASFGICCLFCKCL